MEFFLIKYNASCIQILNILLLLFIIIIIILQSLSENLELGIFKSVRAKD